MRTEYCGQINILNIGQKVTVCGWVNSFRNIGNIIFIDIRDREGILQIFFDSKNQDIFKLACTLRNEFCIQVTGIVSARKEKNKNFKIATGEIEILAEQLKIINQSKPLPLDCNQKNKEETYLKYRYLYLRHPDMIQRLKIRSNITNLVHNFMNKEGFLNIETPILTKSTPEGARDYLVPSRIHKGKFYALPQSPQLFKQLLMISGLDRYYQIVKCFRDEDLRSDRQPEFTQIDIEASFIDAKQICKIIENLVKYLWFNIKGVELNQFHHITFKECMHRYGTDKPDLRNPIELIDFGDIFKIEQFQQTYNYKLENSNFRIAAICVPDGITITQKKINECNKISRDYGAKKLFWIKVINRIKGLHGIESQLNNLLDQITIEIILKRTNAKNGDIIILIADHYRIVENVLGMLRTKMGIELDIINKNTCQPLWITDFPMFGMNEQNNLVAIHHPFTAPKSLNIEKLITDPTNIISSAYDMVINGYEIGGGSVRIHDFEIQKTVFNLLGLTEDEQNSKFNFLLEALKFGAPPHAGFAFGLDRIVMLLTNTNNLRDVIAFPKTTAASCLMTNAPTAVSSNLLFELGLQIIKNTNTR
ncbi:MAG: aspartate--tRNA ligase [Pantoea sp. Brub]|nr:aspartate--tRNA ligase [Pantoea sp. Brub]